MKRLWLPLAVCAGLLAGCASGPAMDDAGGHLERLDWVLGTWQRTDLPAGRSGCEQWQRDGRGFSGVGLASREDGTVFEERLRIEARDGTIVYVADVAHNPAPIVFRLSALDDGGFVFENPAHDFPQVIVYRRDGERMNVRLSAGKRAAEMQFRRAARHARDRCALALPLGKV